MVIDWGQVGAAIAALSGIIAGAIAYLKNREDTIEKDGDTGDIKKPPTDPIVQGAIELKGIIEGLVNENIRLRAVIKSMEERENMLFARVNDLQDQIYQLRKRMAAVDGLK